MGATIGIADLRTALGSLGGAALFGVAATGSTSTTVNLPSSQTIVASRYVGGVLRWVTGALAGQEQTVISNTTSAVTVGIAFSAGPAVGDACVVLPASGGTNDPTATTLVGTMAPSYTGPTTDASGTLAAANTAQQVLAAGKRKYLLFYNLSTADTLWINLGAAATTGAGSIPIPPLSGFEWTSGYIPSDSLSVIGPTAGDAYTAKVA